MSIVRTDHVSAPDATLLFTPNIVANILQITSPNTSSFHWMMFSRIQLIGLGNSLVPESMVMQFTWRIHVSKVLVR